MHYYLRYVFKTACPVFSRRTLIPGFVAIIQDARSLLTDPTFLVSRARLVGYGLVGR